MIVHTGYAKHTITLDDGSVWSWKGDHWLSGMDFPKRLLNRTTDGEYHARRAELFRYNDGKPLTESERAGAASILAMIPAPGQSFIVPRDDDVIEIGKISRYDSVSSDGQHFVVDDQQGRRWLLKDRDNREPGPAFVAVRKLSPP